MAFWDPYGLKRSGKSGSSRGVESEFCCDEWQYVYEIMGFDNSLKCYEYFVNEIVDDSAEMIAGGATLAATAIPPVAITLGVGTAIEALWSRGNAAEICMTEYCTKGHKAQGLELRWHGLSCYPYCTTGDPVDSLSDPAE